MTWIRQTSSAVSDTTAQVVLYLRTVKLTPNRSHLNASLVSIVQVKLARSMIVQLEHLETSLAELVLKVANRAQEDLFAQKRE